MRIGIDLTVLQTAHRMRGIGYTLINFLNYMPEAQKKDHTFIFYIDSASDDPLQLVNLDGYKYEKRLVSGTSVKVENSRDKGKVHFIKTGVRNQFVVLRDSVFGDSRITNLEDVDYFIQFDQNQPVPNKRKVRSTLILYDLIPFVMESDYLWGYKTARAHGRSRKNAARLAAKRLTYYWTTKLNCKNADSLIAISEHTKKDFIKFLSVPKEKISVVLLGVENDKAKSSKKPSFSRFIETSWGPMPRKTKLPEKFILYLGGGDQRRKLVDLLAAFNSLRAQEKEISLVMAGDIMRGPGTTPIKEHRDYYKSVSYIDDIYFLGFVSDDERQYLYENALACVYPSVYEGFGLPVLEAMKHSCPVITYNNSSIPEVGGDAALYASDQKTIRKQLVKLIDDNSFRKEMVEKSEKQAQKFGWEQTATSILEEILKS